MGKRSMKKMLTFVMALCMVLSLAFAVSADSVNDAVKAARDGVVQIQLWYVEADTGTAARLGSGSGFLVNDTHIVTCHHVVEGFDDGWYADRAAYLRDDKGIERTAAQIKENIKYRIYYYRDAYRDATLELVSADIDCAVLKLNQPIGGRTALKLRDSKDLEQMDSVFALGFPGDIDDIVSVNYYESKDVTVTSGDVNKIANMDIELYLEGSDGSSVLDRIYDNVNCIESSALIAAGNSGGPLVDSNGYVVGMNAAGSSTRNIAVSMQEILGLLKPAGIQITVASNEEPPATTPSPTTPAETTPSPTTPVQTEVNTDELESLIKKAEKKDLSVYTEESADSLEEALDAAKDALTAKTQEEVDKAAKALKNAMDDLEELEKKDPSTMIIIAIIAGVVVVLVVIIIVVTSNSKKKAPAPVPAAVPAMGYAPQQSMPRATQVQPQAPQVQPQAPQVQPQAPKNTANIGETTVLGGNAGETTVLSQSVNGGTLVRVSNNKSVLINSADFSVGRDQSSVNYWVDNNSNISRVHARFLVREDKTYIVDNKAANGTFVNGIKLRAGQEVELKNGDTILLGDEKFQFKK